MATYQHVSHLPGATAAELFAWHASPGALARLLPPASGIRTVRAGELRDGSETELSVPVAPFVRRRWVARRSAVRDPQGFIDTQAEGPFTAWRHDHRFERSEGGARLIDDLNYTPPGGKLKNIVDAFVAPNLKRTFHWRHERTARDLERHRAFRNSARLTVGVSGASGLVAGELMPFLTTGGHAVKPFTRRGGGGDAISWDPLRGRIDEAALAGCDAVVHLAGATVSKRWTDAYMHEIRDSRVAGTRLVAEAVARHADRIQTLIIASGVNAYPSGDVELDEEAPSTGEGFLADVVRQWEAAAEPARAAGVRVIHLRTGLVLSGGGGGLAALAGPARFGLGGPVAGGEQYLPWIDLDDLVGLIHHALLDRRVDGVVNACAPEPVRQGHFADVLGQVLHRPAFVPFPEWAVRKTLGRMGEELLLPSLRILSRRTTKFGFRFRSPDLATALRFELARD